MKPNPDADLVAHTLLGDSRAAEALFGSYRAVALAVADNLVGDRFAAEDVVQEASMRAFTRLSQLTDPGAFGAWYAAIIRSVGLDHLRARQRQRTKAERIAFEPQATSMGSDEHYAPVSRQHLQQCLRQLSPSLSEVLRLRFGHDMSVPAIAEALNKPTGTIKRRLHDAIQHMRRQTMTVFDAAAARAVAEEAGRQIAALPKSIRRDVIAVAVGGDLARGDHIDNYSALLVFPLFANRASLSIYRTEAYTAVYEIFDTLCQPYRGYCEAPPVHQFLPFDELHLPTTAERLDPPRVPQPMWHSIYLFDLIDHHFMVYGDDYVRTLYRPDQRYMVMRAASQTLDLVRSRTTSHPAGFPMVAHWQAIKMIRLLQMLFTPGNPTIAWQATEDNYARYVPDFPMKGFGAKTLAAERTIRCYPGKVWKQPSKTHVGQCITFCEQGCEVLLKAWKRQA